MDARSCLLIFMSFVIVLLSHGGHLTDATVAVSGSSSADTYNPSFDFPYNLKAVSRRLKSGRLQPPPPIANRYVHTLRPPMYKPPYQRPSSPPPPPAQTPMST
ncbi:hypothetical protein DITRI_Ditri06bG0144500 [Diplodiscus trichospermus]